ncbi:MAG: dTDP-glucose 4,6-dehydratase [Deltaproteobacteria bacterium]|nr:MAG: dTDP-glucose 4,6-dehydratase [Deltaproteobacteria bacterium]
MTTVLVTGGAGFIGSNYVRHLLETEPGAKVVVIDKLTYAGNLANLRDLPSGQAGRLSFHKVDVADAPAVAEVFSRFQPRSVVHFAAESHVDRSIHEPQVFLKTNVVGTQVLLDACRESWKVSDGWQEGTVFLQVSTDEVYGTLGPEGRFTEDTPLAPRSPYSASKAAADMLVMAYHNTYGLPVAVTRCSNNYGPYQFPEKLIPLMIRNALNHEPLPVYGDGRQVRDWLHVEDHCRALELVRRRARPGSVYNIGGGTEMENIELVKLLVAKLREVVADTAVDEGLIRHVTDRPGHDRRYAIDASRIGDELGWRPQVAFADGLERTIRWYIEHTDWLESIISGEYMDFYEKNYRDLAPGRAG